MRKRNFVVGITFFANQSMYEELKDISDNRQIGLSELIRSVINEYLKTHKNKEDF